MIISQRALWATYAWAYDTVWSLAPYQELMREVTRSLGVDGRSVVLDAGCGTGNIGRAFSEDVTVPTPRILGLDREARMLGRAVRKAAEAQLVCADLSEPLPLATSSVDAVVCCNVLYALPDPAAAMAEFRRVLKPGGRMVIVSPHAHPRLLVFLTEHARVHGWRSLLRVLPGLLLTGVLNVLIVRCPDHAFFTQEQFSVLTGDPAPRRVYSGQALMATTVQRDERSPACVLTVPHQP